MFRWFMARRRLVARVRVLESLVVKLDRVQHPAMHVFMSPAEVAVYDELTVEAAAARAASRERALEQQQVPVGAIA